MELMGLMLLLGACGPLGVTTSVGEASPIPSGATSPSGSLTPWHQVPTGTPVSVGGPQLDAGPMEETEGPTEEGPMDPYEELEHAGNGTLKESEAPTGLPEPETPSPSPEGPTRRPRGRDPPHGGSQGQERATSAELPYCTCDLMPGTCDINCCCDLDCGLSDPLAVFSYCLPGSTKAVSKVCVDSTLLFRNNTPLATTDNATETPDQFCVQTDNSNLNFFIDPQNVTNVTFPGLVAEYGRLSFIQADQPAPSYPPFYKVGDPVLTLSDSSTLGILSQPVAQGPAGACADTNPAGFLKSQSSSCIRSVPDLSRSCTSEPTLNANSYYKTFTVLKVPSAVNMSASQQVKITTITTPATPSMVNGSCVNVVSQVSYVIDYDGTQGIQSISVDFSFTSLSGHSGSSFPQSFTVFFRSSTQITQITVPRSGNPGYVVGATLLTSVDGTRRPVTLMQSQSDGTCSNQVTADALFGVNMRTGCRFSRVASNSCAGFAEQLYEVLHGPESPQNLAMFGNADPSITDGWTNVFYSNCTNQSAGNCSTGCTVPVSLEIQVLWAQVGLRSNPQSQLLGARYQNHCKLLKCQSPVLLETVLSFIDTTLKAAPPRGQPATDWKLPFDFFFPFKVNLNGGSVPERDALYTLLFTCTALTFHWVFRL